VRNCKAGEEKEAKDGRLEKKKKKKQDNGAAFWDEYEGALGWQTKVGLAKEGATVFIGGGGTLQETFNNEGLGSSGTGSWVGERTKGGGKGGIVSKRSTGGFTRWDWVKRMTQTRLK